MMEQKKKKWQTRSLIKKLGISVLGLIAILIVTVVVIPDEYLGGKISHFVSTRLGRDVYVEKIDIGWRGQYPHLHLRNLSIANLPEMMPDRMVKIEEVNVTFKFWPLLRGRLEVPKVSVSHPEVYLEQRDAKTRNWDFPALSAAHAVTETVTPDDRHDMPIIGEIVLTDGVLAYKDTPRQIDMTLRVDAITGDEEKSGGFKLDGTGRLEGRDVKLRAEAGALTMLRDTTQNYPLMIAVTVGNTEFKIDGTFKDPVRLTGLDAVLHLSGDSLSDLYYFTHVALPPTPAFTLDGQLVKQGETWTFRNFEGRVGKSDLSGTVDYNAEGERPLLTGQLYANKLNVSDLGGFVGAEYEKGSPHVKGDRLLPDTSLDLKRLRAGDIKLDFAAKQLNAPGWPLNDMATKISLENGYLAFEPLSFGVADGRVNGYLHLDGKQDVSRVDMDLKIKGMSLSRFFKDTSFDELSRGRINGRIDLEGQGNALSTVLGGSNGRISLLMSGGKISLLLVEAMDIDIAQLTPLFFGKDKSTAVRCAVGDFIVSDGLLNANAFILDTDDTNVKGGAKINLKNEGLNIDLNARPKDASFLALQSKILVRGTMANPSIMIDPLTTGIRAGAAALFSVVTPLAAILPFIEVGKGEDADCSALLEMTEKPATAAQKAKARKEATKATKQTKKEPPTVNP